MIGQLVDPARADGLLQQLTKRVLESALEGEMTGHLGYEKHKRDEQVANRPVYVALAVTVDGTRHPRFVGRRRRRGRQVLALGLGLSSRLH